MRRLHLFAFLLPQLLVWAQDFAIPSSWQHTDIAQSHQERIQISQNALQQGAMLWDDNSKAFNATSFNPESQPIIYSSMAWGGYMPGTQNAAFLDDLRRGVKAKKAFTISNTETYIPAYWGLVALDLYRAFRNDTEMLDIAKDRFEEVAQSQITREDAALGKHPQKVSNSTFPSSCNGTSVAGGVFWSVYPKTSLFVNSISTGFFALLSAYLAEIEAQTGGSNSTYKDAAILSAQYVLNHHVNNEGLVTRTTIDLTTPNCLTNEPESTTLTNGIWIEAFTVLADVTGDTKWRDIMLKIVRASTQDPVIVDNNDGIILENDDISLEWQKGRFIRSLYTPFTRLTSDTSLQKYITAFVSAQYNALLTNATQGNSNLFNPSWHGPPATKFSPGGLLAALDVLSTGAKLPSTTNSGSPSSSSGGGSKKGSSLSKGALAGIGVGVAIVVLLAVLAAFLYIRQRHRNRSEVGSSSEKPSHPSTPFFQGVEPFPTTASAPSSTTPPSMTTFPREEAMIPGLRPREKGPSVLASRDDAAVLEQQNLMSSGGGMEGRPTIASATMQGREPQRDAGGPSNQDIIQLVDGLLRDRGLGDRPPQYRAHEDERNV